MSFFELFSIKIVSLIFLAIVTESQKPEVPTMTPKPTGPHDMGERTTTPLNPPITTTLSPAEKEKKKYLALMSTTTKKMRFTRTTPARQSFEENCDYLAHYCLKAYNTGKLCARTLYYTYHNFKNYCLMDYVNCMERYDVWQVVHMGECFNVTVLTEYLLYQYDDDYFLDQIYAIEDH